DKEKKVVAIVSDSEVIVNDEYQVIFDQKEEYRFIDCGNGIVRVVKEKTPQEIHQEELVKLCSPIIEFLKQQSHPYHTVLIKEDGIELLETKQYIPQTIIQEVDKKCDINLMIDGKEMSKLLINRCFFI
ncbi:hypothetical protein, partial [Turicibacter sanguinis]|uniref:hypothetical protein n=1 Tax=Turicibacter sanguinis TaxID=154288 RepID=UPI00294347EB